MRTKELVNYIIDRDHVDSDYAENVVSDIIKSVRELLSDGNFDEADYVFFANFGVPLDEYQWGRSDEEDN